MPANRRRAASTSGGSGAGQPPRGWWRVDLRLLVWLLLAVNFLLCLGVLASPRGIQGYLRKRAEVANLELKLQQLRESNQEWFGKIERFREDPRIQERMIKEQLGWARTNETVIEFPSASAAPRVGQ
jgi:cell division protein FtsB